MEYHYLISGLPDLKQANAKTAPAQDTLLEELQNTLAPADLALLAVLRMRYDNANLLSYLADKDAKLNPLGNLSAADWQELITLMDELDVPKDNRLQPYVLEFYRMLNDEKAAAEMVSKEDFLATLYYDFGTGSKNTFLAEWFSFCLNLNNILTATICRKHGFDVKQAVIGNNEVAQALRTSSARDFGLSGLLSDADKMMALAEEQNLLEREKKIDALKWAWLEEHTFFHFFGVEHVLAYWLQCELLHRWDGLTVEQGKEIFKNVLNDLKKDVKF